MILDLRVFEEFPAETAIEADEGEFDPLDDSVVRVDSVGCELAIQKSAQEYFCQGRVKARMKLECARCLADFGNEVDTDISFVVCSKDEAEQYRGRDDEDYVCFEGNDLQVNIVEPVRQALVLALPMKPLCSEDCRGLCSRCGANLNRKQCDCNNDTTDPRWDGLKGLIKG